MSPRLIRLATAIPAALMMFATLPGCGDSRVGGPDGMRTQGVQANTKPTLPAASSPAAGTETVTEGPADGKPKP